MSNINKTINKILFGALVIFITSFLIIGQQNIIRAEEITEAEITTDNEETDADVIKLNQEIQDRQQKLEEMGKQAKEYQQKVNYYQNETASLKNQQAVLKNRIAKTELDIKSTEIEIETANLEIEKLTLQIAQTQAEIDQRKIILGANLNLINKLDQKNYLEVFVLNNSFSEFFNQLQYLDQIQTSVHESLEKVKEAKCVLGVQNSNWQSKEQELTDLKLDLEDQLANLTGQQEYKNYLLVKTRSSELQFQNLLLQLKQEQQQIENDITGLEKQIREKMAGETDKSLPGVVALRWPVPNRGITAYFHDPDYPFRYIFEHPAIDIRASQGTPIKAAESGYVARAKDAGMGYSYIMLIHGNNLSTVYGHVSGITVQEDQYVVKGQVIGLSGGMPGTPGAGNLSTGPHLHFEVRYKGVPVNPLEYLP